MKFLLTNTFWDDFTEWPIHFVSFPYRLWLFVLKALEAKALPLPPLYTTLAGSIIFPHKLSLPGSRRYSTQLQGYMNIYFSKVVKAGDRQREFNFRKLTNSTEGSYHVDVNDDKGNRIIFTMYRNADGKWKTSAQKLPLWIHNAEMVLGEVIDDHLKEEKAIK